MFSKLSKKTYCKRVIPFTFVAVIKIYNCDFERSYLLQSENNLVDGIHLGLL